MSLEEHTTISTPTKPATFSKSLRSPSLGDFQIEVRVLLIISMAAVVGIFGATAAWLLSKLIVLTTNVFYFGQVSLVSVSISKSHLGLIAVLLPAIGGLIIGVMARYGSEKIRGHGIPEAIEAILIGGSKIQPKVAILKPLSSAISIGTGGPFGAEGPIIMTGGAMGSLFAQLFHLSATERKILLVAGAAAGMTGIFGTPVAAILLAVELLLFEWRPRSFLPVAMAVVVAAILRNAFFPAPPLFTFMTTVDLSWKGLGAWIGIGISAGLGSVLLTSLVYGTEDFFQKLPIHWMWWPAIGGLIVGVGGLIEPAALGMGYDNLQSMLQGQLLVHALISLLIVKAIIWAIALGSGTSGGVLAPLLMIGGAIGGLEALAWAPDHVALFSLLGMAAMMGGTMRSPLTATIFAVEITCSPGTLLPLITACAAAHAVTVLLLKRSILTERISRRGHHILRDYSVDPFEMARVHDVMVTPPDSLPASMSLDNAVEFFTTTEHRHKSYPIIDANNHLVGMVSRGDVLRWTIKPPAEYTTLLAAIELANQDLLVGYPDELVGHLADRMANADVGRIPIINPENGALMGIVTRKDLLRVRAKIKAHEHERTAPLRPSKVPSL